MPNLKGGKGYKKGKHTMDEKFDVQMISWDSSDGQMLGRITKTLGQRRFRVYCNDNFERTCRLAGSVRKSQWVAEGCVVVVSLRFLGSGSAGGAGEETGDILQVVDPRLYGKLKKMEGMNQNLFVQIETMDKEVVKRRIAAGENVEEEDDFFDRDEVVTKEISDDIDIDEI